MLLNIFNRWFLPIELNKVVKLLFVLNVLSIHILYDRVKVCVDCGYYELTKNGKTQIYEGEGVFALNHKDNGGIFPIEKGNFEACLKDILMVISEKLHTNLDNVDDCVLHSVKNGKVVTIDFKGML